MFYEPRTLLRPKKTKELKTKKFAPEKKVRIKKEYKK